MKVWKGVIAHHSASSWGSRSVIDKWHKEPPRNWREIGYHFVILNGYPTYEDWKEGRRLYSLIGSIELGRSMDLDVNVEVGEMGAHALYKNSDHIGICLIHNDEDVYDTMMIRALYSLVKDLMSTFKFSRDSVLGHYEVASNKPHCPGIDMEKFRKVLPA